MHNQRSHAMDGLKLLFMFLIVLHHSFYLHGVLYHAYMAVDLFFMTSGFMLMRTLQHKPKLTTNGYLISRIRKMYPHYVFSFAVMLLSTSVYKAGGLSLQTLLRSLPELLLIQNLGIFDGGVNYPCWYMSVLIFAGVLIFFLGRKLPLRWFNGLGLVCTIVSYGYILASTGGSMETFAKIGIFYLPFWRGMAGLFAGTLLFQLHERFKPAYAKYARIFQAAELISLAAAVLLMWVPARTDGPILLLLWLLLLSVGSERSILNRVSNCRAVAVSIRYEYAVFLNHAFVIGIMKKLVVERFSFPVPVNLAILLAVLVVYSVITETFISKAVELFSSRKKQVKL